MTVRYPQDLVYQPMQHASPEALKQDHQKAQSAFNDNDARYITELLDWERSSRSTSGTPTQVVPIALVELGLEKLVTSTELIAQNQQELMAIIQTSLEAS